MTSIENNITSHDEGRIPYEHDTERGKWTKKYDFFLACMGHSFNIRSFGVMTFFQYGYGGLYSLIPYSISMILFIMPIYFIQSFLGQFSSTGTISVFRISPFFKGIGYVILLFNIISVIYNSALSSYSLMYLLSSLTIQPAWMTCNNTWNTPNCTTEMNNFSAFALFELQAVFPQIQYFNNKFLHEGSYFNEEHGEISWSVLGCLLFTWIAIILCFRNGITSVSQIVRYTTPISFFLFGIFLLHLIYVHGVSDKFLNHLTEFDIVFFIHSMVITPFLSALIFGTGWGTILTMASYNQFRLNIGIYSTIIPSIIGFCPIISDFSMMIIREFLYSEIYFDVKLFDDDLFNFIYIVTPIYFSKIKNPSFWAAIFYLMIYLCEFNSLIIQMLTILTALFDEFFQLRFIKKQIMIGTCSILFLFSIILATNYRFNPYHVLSDFGDLSQMAICLLELLMVLWVYGRVRFQRDVHFMLKRPFPSWLFYVWRFITPLFILFTIFLCLVVDMMYFTDHLLFLTVAEYLPWIIVPAYAIYRISINTGSIINRLKKCIKPTDWYPVDPHYRQKYEQTLGTSDISHQLLEMNIHEDNL